MKYCIIITTCNHCEDYLKPCITSIEANSNMEETEIVVIANGCKDNTREYLESKKLKYFWFDELIGYTNACNEGMMWAQVLSIAEYIVLLNDDTVIMGKDWLNILEKPFIDNPKTGITGPVKFTFDCGGITRTAMAFWCVMFRRSLMNEIGLLDEDFNPGMGEDGDYSIRAEYAGYELVQVPVNKAKAFGEGVSDTSFPIFHKGNGTFADNVDVKNKVIERNKAHLAKMYGPKKVSIIIPTYNHLDDCLRPCIESILKYTDLDDCEVLISANGCTDGTREYVNSLGAPFRLIWNDKAVGFPQAINDGIKHSVGEFIVLLNNDTTLLERKHNEWMDMLLEPFEDPAVGLTGPLMDISPPAGNHSFLIFFCVAIRREVIEKIGLLDTAFGIGGGEDTDFCIRAERAGYKLIQVPGDALVRSPEFMGGVFPIYHKAESTVHDAACVTDWKAVFEKNSSILRERYCKPVRVSIVIPTYNHLEDALKPCLEAVLKYTDLTDKEVIVVPNGCTDGTLEYLQSLGGKIKIIPFEKPMGYIVPVNAGAKQASGEYIVLLSNDCILTDQTTDHWIQTMLAPFLADNTVGLTGPLVYNYPGLGRVIHGGCAMYKKEAWEQAEGYDPIFTYGYISDVDMSLRISAAGYKVVAVPEDPLRDAMNGTFLIHFPIYTSAKVVTMDRHADAQLIGKNRALTAKRHNVKPSVSIVVPTCNRLDTLRICIDRIFEYTDCLDKEIIVVANGCTDGTLNYLNSLGDCLTFINIPEASGHVIPANAGAAAAKAPFIVLLDDDSHLQPQEVDTWITLLKRPFSEDVSVGMTGVFVAEYPYLGEAIHSGCSMYRKDVWEQVGGGDLAFGFGYLYDTDLSLRIKKEGYRIVAVGLNGSFPLYHPGSPINTESKLKNVSLIRKNREILYRRHAMKPKYSIVIPTYNHLEDCLKPCLESLIKHTHLADVEVIVVANGCKDKTAEYIDSLGYPFKLVWFDEGLGFTKATNEGIKVAQGDYIVLLNNDTVLLDKGQAKNTWMDMLVAPFADDKVGITGPLMLHDSYADADVMIFFCVMIRRDMFDKIGLLDESYSPGGGEDIDFCVKLVQAGYRQVVVPDPNVRVDKVNDGISEHTNVGSFPIYHAGEGTFSKKEFPEYGNKIIKDNGMKNMIRYNKHIKLNIGSGGVEIPGYISLDKYDLRAHILMDVFDMDKYFPENSVEEILASHLFEHVNPYKSVDLLKSWLKILKPGGKLIMEVPNIEELCKDFVTADKQARYGILNCIYGAVNTQDDNNREGKITAPHLWGWYPEMMYDHLVWAGYSNIKFGPEQIPHPLKNFRVEAAKNLVFRDFVDKFIYDNVEPAESVLDLGCGDKQRTKMLTRGNKVVSVDAWEKTQPDLVLDLETGVLPFGDASFDVVLMIDFVEHLNKESGQQIIAEAQRVCKKKIILFTPAYWTENRENIENPELWSYQNEYDLHKSFWTVNDFAGWKEVQYPDQRFFLRVWEKNEILNPAAVL